MPSTDNYSDWVSEDRRDYFAMLDEMVEDDNNEVSDYEIAHTCGLCGGFASNADVGVCVDCISL